MDFNINKYLQDIFKNDIGDRINIEFKCCNIDMEYINEDNKYMCSKCGILKDNDIDEDMKTKKIILNINNGRYTGRYYGKNVETREEKQKKIVSLITSILLNSKVPLNISTKTINDAADMIIDLRSNGTEKSTIIKKDKFMSTLLVAIRQCGCNNGELWEYDRELIKVFSMNNSGFSLGEKFIYDTSIKKGISLNHGIRYDLYFIKYLSLSGIKYDKILLDKLITLLKRILYKNIAYSSNMKSKTIAIIYIYSQLKYINIDKNKYINLLQIEKATFDSAWKSILRNIYKIKIRYFI